MDTVTLRSLTLAVDDLTNAKIETNNGLVADHCDNAISEIKKAMLMAMVDDV